MRRAVGALPIVVLATASTAHADLRSFTRTFEYATMPEGHTAVELWHTQTRADSESTSPQLYQGMLEIEHGLTEHFDMGFFTVLEQVAGGDAAQPLHLSAVELQTRYRFSERGERPVDTMIYGGVAKQFGESLYKIEAKLIGARDFGDVSFAANGSVAVKVGKDVDDIGPAFGWAFGVTYQASPRLRIGAETWGAVDDEEAYASAGPALSFAAAPSFWTAVTVGFGLTDEPQGVDHGYFSARAIVGFEL
jgi:hypothetical protein